MIRARKGFTIIELTISMVFISIMILAIAATIILTADSYNKGLTLKAVTTAGSSVSTDMQRSIGSSMPFSVDAGSPRYVADSFGGRLCLDKYSYIWNYGKAINQGTARNKFTSGTNTIRLSKVPDVGGAYCLNSTSTISPTDAVDLLSSGERNLSIHQFVIESATTAFDSLSNNRLYNVTFTIGTNVDSAMNADYLSCKQPGVSGADPAYCSVQQFTFSVVAGNLYQG